MNSDERIARLRERLLAENVEAAILAAQRDPVVMAASLRASESAGSWQVRRGMLTRDRLAATRFDVDPLDPLAGRLRLGEPRGTAAERVEAEAYVKQIPWPPGQTGHCELDLGPLFEGGIDGIRADIEGRLGSADGEEAEAYQSFLFALEGFSGMIEHAAEDARAKGITHTAESCERIAHEAPETFRDAIQLLWFAIFGVMFGEDVGLVVPGHLDRTLYPFFVADRAKGILDDAEALVFIEGLYLLINYLIPDGLAMSVMVGGRDADGRDMTNELSYLSLEALRRTRMVYPTVGVCWHEGTPEDLAALAVDLIGHGNPNAAFFGDETIQRGLKALGVPEDQACHYINSTCVEITPARGSNIWVASPYFSTCRILLDEVECEVAGHQDGGGAVVDFESFMERYFKRLGEHIAEAVESENTARRARQEYGRKPLQSVFTRDCIERGRDIDDGGALYNWVECSFVGLANLVDSLHVIREEVFERKALSLGELKAVLDADFGGHDAVRRRFLEHHAKYGHDCAAVDGLFQDVIAFVQQECAKHAMEPDGGPFVPGAFCWVMHERLGRECPATPDGRKAGVAFADGCGPAQGREKLGPTAAILSTTSWDHSAMIGGLAYNMKFNSTLFESSEGFERLRDLVLTFLRRGGFETQINVVDAETLKEARRNPDAYRDLVVRIGGYTDYFTRLTPEMQDEIIMRTEFTHA